MTHAPPAIALALAALTLTGCATARPPTASPGIVYARIGDTVDVGGPDVTPLAIVEDSRCPKAVQCVWAGRLRISARIDLGSGSVMRELTLGEPQPVADGSLELVEAAPNPIASEKPEPGDYRLGFRFMGGL